jgi:energy-coupling factor transport system substrate-specific component
MTERAFKPKSEKLVASGADTLFRDLVFLGVMNALVIFLSHVIYFLIITPGLFVLNFYYQAITNLVTTTLLLLMIYRVPRFGVMTLHGAILGAMALMQGFWAILILFSLPAGLLADTLNRYLFRAGKTPLVIISLCVFIVLYDLGTWWPITFLKDADFVQRMAQSDPTSARLIATMTLPLLLSQAAANCITTCIGGFFGHRLIKKHFEKAGLV